MYEKINKRIEELKADVNRYRKLDGILNNLEKDREKLETKLKTLKEQLDKENHDVKKYEGLSLTGMFHKLFGSYDVQLDKEKQEAFTAQLKYNQCLFELNNVKSEIENKRYEKTKYKNCSYDLEKALTQKVEMLKKSESNDSEKVMVLSDKITDSKTKLREINEALNVGDSVIKAIEKVQDSLKSAQGWGVWDMIGGGMVSSAIKHSHINKAKSQASNVQTLLRMFKNELLDIEITESININIQGFDTFIDFFADGLIADYFVQTKINSSKDSVDKLHIQINNITTKLFKLKNEEEAELQTNSQQLLNIMSRI